MNKNITTIFLFLVVAIASAQFIVINSAYKANFSNSFRATRYVSYTLYKGGGSCSRATFRFMNDKNSLNCPTDADYKNSGYEKGHLANAEDFAFDCEKDELTFRYYNCLPQTQNLNRGLWKQNETQIRKWSQTDKLYIICGGYFTGRKMNNCSVPDYCWKIVQSTTTKQILFCGWFKNSDSATLENIDLTELEKRLKSKIILIK